MTERERQRTDDPQPGTGSDAATGGEELDAIRRRVRDVITAGDEAIARVLTTDSRSFLRASEQEGGQ
jgi:hypothetical protein